MALNNLLFLNIPILILVLFQHLSINLFPKILLFLVVKLNIVLASSTGVQGKILVSNSTSFLDIASKYVLSTVPVTDTLCNIN